MEKEAGFNDDHPAPDLVIVDVPNAVVVDEGPDVAHYHSNVAILNQSRIGHNNQSLYIDKVQVLEMQGLLHNRDVVASHVQDLLDSMVESGGPIPGRMQLKACVDLSSIGEMSSPLGPVHVRDLIQAGSLPIYIMSGRHRFDAGIKYQRTHDKSKVEMTVDLYDLNKMNMNAALYVIARDNEAEPKLPKLVTCWIDHAETVRRVILVMAQAALGLDKDLLGSDLVCDLSESEENGLLDTVREGALSKKVGKFTANNFFGDVIHMCWGALMSESRKDKDQSREYIRPMRRMAFLSRSSFNQAKRIYKHIVDIDVTNSSASNALISLFGNTGVPTNQLIAFYDAAISRFIGMIEAKTANDCGFTKKMRTLGDMRKKKEQAKESFTFESIENEAYGGDREERFTLPVISADTASNDERSTSSSEKSIRGRSGSLRVAREKPDRAGVDRSDDEEDEHEPSSSHSNVEQPTSRQKRPRSSSSKSPSYAVGTKKLRSSNSKQANPIQKKQSHSKQKKSLPTPTTTVGPLQSDGTVSVNGKKYKVLSDDMLAHSRFVYENCMGKKIPQIRHAQVSNREAKLVGETRKQCLALFPTCSIAPHPE